MIQLYNISKSYDPSTKALDSVSLSVEKGGFLYITGASGAGKSTLLKIIFGAESPTSGQIVIDGRNYQRIPRSEIPLLRRRIGFVFQDYKLLGNKTAFENVALALKVMGVDSREIKKRVLRALAYLKVEHRANFKAMSLSGGEQQRVAIARAIVKEPMIMLADEPTGSLDPRLAEEITELFNDLNCGGTTFIVATHDVAMVEKSGKTRLRLQGGRVAP